MRINAAPEGYRLRFPTIEDPRKELSHTRFGISRNSFRLEDLAALPVWSIM